MKKWLSSNWSLILYFALSIVAILPFMSSGFFQIHDDVQVARVYEMAKSLSSGAFPVRWVADLGYGLGYPIFNFYSVLPYYVGGFITMLGVDVLIATKIIFGTVIILSGVSMYFLVKGFFGSIPALVSSIAYLYFPYHAVNIYVRGDLAELTAYVFLPLVFLSLFKLHESAKDSKKYLILGSLSVAAVVISHNLTAFMLFIFIGIYIVASLLLTKNRKTLFLSYASVLVIGFLLSAFYSIPASLESKYRDVMSQIGGGSHYADHFICLTQLWDSPWGFGGSAPGCIDGVSFKLGKSNIIFAILGLLSVFLIYKKLRENRFIVLISIFFLFLSIFLTTEYSLLLWNLPLMDFLQFPWRFLNFVGLFGAFMIGFLVWASSQVWSKKTTLVIGILIIAITIALNGKLFVPQFISSKTAKDYTNPFYLKWTASKISDEYLPKNFGSPGSPQVAKEYFQKLKLDKNTLYKKTDKRFSFEQTGIERMANLLSVLGVVALILVIIGKRNHGKKVT